MVQQMNRRQLMELLPLLRRAKTQRLEFERQHGLPTSMALPRSSTSTSAIGSWRESLGVESFVEPAPVRPYPHAEVSRLMWSAGDVRDVSQSFTGPCARHIISLHITLRSFHEM